MSSPIDSVARIIRKSLESGQTVEIEGLGSFRASANGYEFVPETSPRVFIAYAAEDLMYARRLCEALRAAGFSPWLDKDKLLPGQNWPRAIDRAIEVADGFVACLSPRSIYKRGQFQSELRYALDCARRRPLDEPFLIPVRLVECPVPRRIAEQVQYVDLFPDWQKGVDRVVDALRRRTPEPAALTLGPMQVPPAL
jgi:TIR domain